MVRTDYTIRLRRADDLPALAAALVRVHAQDGYPVEGVADPLAWLEHRDALRSWSALVDGAPVGQVMLTEAGSTEDAYKLWKERTGGAASNLTLVARLFVDPDHRTAGVGRGLINAAIGHARQTGRSVALDVMAKDQAAIRLYERMGGRRLGEVLHRFGQSQTELAIVFDFPV